MVREGRHSGIDDDTRARARLFAEDAGMPKPAVTGRAIPKQRVVSKKELEESGLSLRDFLNRERGLTRRGNGTPAKAAPKMQEQTYTRKMGAATENRTSSATPPKDSDYSNEGRGSKPKGSSDSNKSLVDQIPLDAPRTPVKGDKADSTELGRNVGNAMNALPGIQAAGRILGAAKAAQKAEGSRAVSTAVNDGVTFLGKSGRRQVGGFDEVASPGARQLTDESTRRLANPTKKLDSPSKTKSSDIRRNTEDDDLLLGMKRGGKVKSGSSKPAAKGWGMARGARAAKMR